MRTSKGEKYCSDPAQLFQQINAIKLAPCPHCKQMGFLIRHSYLRGYDEFGQEQVVRGQRLFCSNRRHRGGCGQTFPVLLADVFWGFMVRARTLWKYLLGVLDGLSRKKAWEQAQTGFSLQSGYRLWNRLDQAQTHIRTLLLKQHPFPDCAASEPLAQMVQHLVCVFPSADCPFEEFQNHFQSSLLG
jgi:hypothetical protein